MSEAKETLEIQTPGTPQEIKAVDKAVYEARKVVCKEYPKAFGRKAGGTYRVLSGVSIPPILAFGSTAVEAWERAAREVEYANGTEG